MAHAILSTYVMGHDHVLYYDILCNDSYDFVSLSKYKSVMSCRVLFYVVCRMSYDITCGISVNAKYVTARFPQHYSVFDIIPYANVVS